MNRRKLLILAGVITASVAVITIGQGQVSTAPRFATEIPSLAFEDDKLLLAIPLMNIGLDQASTVVLTKITLGTQVLKQPALPFAAGDIGGGKNALLQLQFSNAGLVPEGKASLTLQGNYRYGGRTLSFQVNRGIVLPAADDGAQETREVVVTPQDSTGGLPPVTDTFDPMDANEEDEGFPLPIGKIVGTEQPDVSEILPPRTADPPGGLADAIGPQFGLDGARRPQAAGGRQLAANDPTSNPRYGTFNVQAVPSNFFPWDPSGASVDVAGVAGNNRVVFLTGNTYALFSVDGGTNFTKINPTTIFPNNVDGGLCCDQVVQYVPSINRMIWFMQFKAVPLFDANGNPLIGSDGKQIKGKNRMRIAAAKPQDMITNINTAWKYWDLTSYGTFNFGNGWMDYPDMSFTNTHLHISIDLVGTGLFITRIPLADIQAGGGISLRYTSPSYGKEAYGSHLTQDSTDAAYWFAHMSTSSLRIFEWPDNSTSFTWRTRTIDSWKNSDYVSMAPNGQDWLSFGFGRSTVRGATVRVTNPSDRRIKIAWSAARGSGFAQPYVRMCEVRKQVSGGTTTWSVGANQQIWNSSFAFQHPYMTTAGNGEVGINTAYGGPSSYPTPLVGFVGDSTMHFIGKSTTAINRWGDYSAIRKHGGNSNLFSVSDYYLSSDNGVVHQYRLFGRSASVP